MTYWAKTGTDGAFLPLERHLADAGSVAKRLWELALTPRQRAWFAQGYGVDEEAAGAWVTFLAASHDVGKASPDFQWLVGDLAERLLPRELRGSRHGGEKSPHDAIGGAVLIDWLESRGASRRVADYLAATISGHHSAPRPRGRVRSVAGKRAGSWKGHQRELIEALAAEFGVDRLPLPAGVSPAAVLATAGLVCVADWIASDADRFPVRDGERDASGQLAEAAVRAASWAPRTLVQPKSFEELFEGKSPRGTQRAVLDALARRSGGTAPFLMLVEDRPGSGKTEAAFSVIQHGIAGGNRGFYIGMPTQATANQLHRRTAEFLSALWPGSDVSPRLLHGGVHPDDPDMPQPTGVDSDEDTGLSQDERDAIAQMWFSQTRRGLLGPYAVGTVDQALLATLEAKFYPVRLLGLQGKVVVLDEVHAYDTYTGLLLEGLVGWLGALGCTVVLLSATLAPPQRKKLVSAYLNGLDGGPDPDPKAPATGAYPRVTIGSADGVETVEVVDDRPGREVKLAWEPIADRPEEIGERALEEVADGGCIAVVCSTVQQAQELFVALRDRCREDDGDAVKLELFHARMRPLERGPIERRLLESLGPPPRGSAVAALPRAERMIVVATQVIEQSLDIDFDAMFTQLAPVDLLIQRAGRVHRHERDARPPRHSEPRLTILDTPGESPVRERSPGSDAVYVSAALARTRLALLGKGSLKEPDDLDPLIAAVYEPRPDLGRDEEEQQSFKRLEHEADQERRKHGAWANEAALATPAPGAPPWERRSSPLRDQEDPAATVKNSAATRFSEQPSVRLTLLRPDELPGVRLRPSRRDVTALLERTVPVSSRRVTGPLLNSPWSQSGERGPFQPPGWSRNSRLRYQFLVELDADGRPLPGVVEDKGESVVLPIRLDAELGLMIEDGG